MNTIKLHKANNWTERTAVEKQNNAWDKFTAFEDGQAKNRTAWFLVSLMTQGVLFLPIPAALMYYYNAPIFVLAITMALFFANVIAGMGGSGIRTMISLFTLSILVHLLMMAIFII
ncbi:MAG TPA: hypothetical protein VK668_12540 [Mucilaginibacter sp.]|nr:hypothetical protein [Mucilaginibacter sp.]